MDDLKIGIFLLIDDHYKFNFNMKTLYIIFVSIGILFLIMMCLLCKINKIIERIQKMQKIIIK